MLATKRRTVSVMNSDVLIFLDRNPEFMIKIGKFSKKNKKNLSKNTEKTKMDL